MADSNITCSGLIATPGVGQVELSWTVTNPNEGGLSYLDLRVVEVWAASTNNLSLATKVREGFTVANHVVTPGETRYYWIRALNTSGKYGDWYPPSSIDGVPATSLNVDTIIAGTIKTAASGKRIELNPVTNALEVYDADNELVSSVGDGAEDLTVCFVSRRGIFAQADNGVATATFVGSDGSGGIQVTCSGEGIGVQGGSEGTYGVLWTHDGQYGVYSQNLSASYAFYAGSGGYGPFTGAHDGYLDKSVIADVGDVLVDLDVVSRNGISDVVTHVSLCSEDAQRTAIGVLVARNTITLDTVIAARNGKQSAGIVSRFDLVVINAVGEGQINVCGKGGSIVAGDLLITSSVFGKAMRQSDDVIRSSTVARARESYEFLSPSDVAQIACIYLCG